MENVVTEKRPQRYTDLLLDWTFKRVFGENGDKRLIISLLNSLLGLDITDVTYLPSEHTRETEESKSHVIDIRCKCSDGTWITVEVQHYWQDDFFNRCMAYVTTEYHKQGRSGKKYGDDVYSPVYLLAIISEKATFRHRLHAKEYDDKVIYRYQMREKDSGELLSETINVTFAELEKFCKDEKDCENMEDKWLYVLKNIGRLDTLPPKFRMDVFQYLFEAVDITKFTPSEMEEYLLRELREKDEYNIMDSARNDGIRQGKSDRSVEIARGMKDKGLDIAMIAELTGLTEMQIAAL